MLKGEFKIGAWVQDKELKVPMKVVQGWDGVPALRMKDAFGVNSGIPYLHVNQLNLDTLELVDKGLQVLD